MVQELKQENNDICVEYDNLAKENELLQDKCESKDF